MNTTPNANLFSRLFDRADPARLAIETVDGRRISYGDLIARAGQTANVLAVDGFDRKPLRVVEAVEQAGKQVGVLESVHASFRKGGRSEKAAQVE